MWLRRDICLGTLDRLPASSRGYQPSLFEQLNVTKAAGYEAVISWDHWPTIQAAGLIAIGMARVVEPKDALPIAHQPKQKELEITTLHVGTDFERRDEMNALAEAVLDAAARTGHALHIETHRGTMTQDIYRTLKLAERWTDLAFTLDFSHYYTGHEMTYGGEFATRLARLLPLFRQVKSILVRMGDTGRIHRSIDPKAHFVLDHLQALKCCIDQIRKTTDGSLKALSIAPELLSAKMNDGTEDRWICYAEEGEDVDRFSEAFMLSDLIDIACAPDKLSPHSEPVTYA